MPGKLIFALFAAVIGAVGWNFSRAPSAGVVQQPEEASAPAAASVTVAKKSHRFRPEAGFRYVYGFERSIAFDGTVAGAKIPPVVFAGELRVDVLHADKDGFEAVVSEQVKGAPTPKAPLARIVTDARGENATFYRAETLDEEERQHVAVVKDLLALWIFPLRADTVGEFEARFEPLPAEPGFARERKIKVAYTSHAPGTPTILSSEHLLLWDNALQLPREVKGEETTRLGEGETALTAASRYILQYKTRGPAPSFSAATLSTLQGEDSLALGLRHPANFADHPDYAHLDLRKILRDLEGAETLTSSQQLALFGDLMKYLRLHPESAADLSARLLDGGVLGAASAEFRALVGALATSGTPAALAALRSAYDDPSLAAAGKATILAALTTTQAPLDANTVAFLGRTSRSDPNPDLAQTALYALGASAQGATGATAAAVVTELASRYQAAGDEPSKLAVLDAIGNSGRPEFLPLLEHIAQGNGSAAIRAKAEFAMRFVNNAASASDLAAGLSSSSAPVRAAAAGAMSLATWSEVFRAPLGACAGSDPNAGIQGSCRSTLAKHPQVAGR